MPGKTADYYDEAGRPQYYDDQPQAAVGADGYTLNANPSAAPAPKYQTIGQQALSSFRQQNAAGKARQILLDPAGLFQPTKINPQYLGGSPEAYAAQLQGNEALGNYYRDLAAQQQETAAQQYGLPQAQAYASGVYDSANGVIGAGRQLTADAGALSGAGSAAAQHAARLGYRGARQQDRAIRSMIATADQRTPSLAEAQARAGVQQIQQQQLAQAAGSGSQLAARNAMYAGANASAAVDNQAAQLRAQEEALRQQRMVQARESAAQQYGQRTAQGLGAQAQGFGAQAQGLGAQAAGGQLQGLGVNAQLGATNAQTSAATNLGQLGLGREQLYSDAASRQQQLGLTAEQAQLEADSRAEAARVNETTGAKGRAGGILGGFAKLFGG